MEEDAKKLAARLILPSAIRGCSKTVEIERHLKAAREEGIRAALDTIKKHHRENGDEQLECLLNNLRMAIEALLEKDEQK